MGLTLRRGRRLVLVEKEGSVTEHYLVRTKEFGYVDPK